MDRSADVVVFRIRNETGIPSRFSAEIDFAMQINQLAMHGAVSDFAQMHACEKISDH
jgi:hypothetical protein